MIETISLVLTNDDGETLQTTTETSGFVEMKIEKTIADIFTEISRSLNAISDDEIRTAKKFHFGIMLQNYRIGGIENGNESANH